MDVLRAVRALGLPDCWVAAGFVRNCVWDHVHGLAASPLSQDIDVIWFYAEQGDAARDASLERALRDRDGTLDWSVKNQARMHVRNGDAPYASATDAMRYWPETATAVGVRLGQDDTLEVAAPFGLDDLFGLVVQPTRRFAEEKRAVYLARFRAKDWPGRWPRLRIEMPA
nr:nucleotidyltransferase family protein [Telluria antibiotica]